MEISVKSGNPEKQRSACVVVGIFERRKLSPAAEQMDEATNGYISSILRRGDLEGKLGQVLLLHNIENVLCDRILLVGCGKERNIGYTQYRQIIIASVNTLNETGAMDAVSYLTDLNIKGKDTHWKVRQAVECVHHTLYSFDKLKSQIDTERRPIRKLILNVPNRRELNRGERAVREGNAIAEGSRLARELGNLPGNICTPTYLAKQSMKMSTLYQNMTVTVLEQDEIEKLGMGSFLSVSRGSRQAPKLITIEYSYPGNNSKPYVFVGKGITFDSGGISIKPSPAMDEMKFDMCGAASVIGTMAAIGELQPDINVVAVIPSCENMPDGDANKPGDVVTSMSGMTIEVLNTDAEGRLILCDALTYSEKFDPHVVIDVATLTGACVVALGSQAAGLIGNHSPLVNELLAAGQYSGDRAWELPLWDEYQDQLKSNFADIANIGGKEAGTITAACFLSRFTKKYHWAHLDIAGVAWTSGKNKGATGRPVPLLTQYLLDQL